MEDLIFTGKEWEIFWPVLWRSLLITESIKRFMYLAQGKDSPMVTVFVASAAAFTIAWQKDADIAFAMELSIYIPLLHLVALRIAMKFIQKQTGVNVAEIFEGQTYRLTKTVKHVVTGEERVLDIDEPTPDDFKTVMAPKKGEKK